MALQACGLCGSKLKISVGNVRLLYSKTRKWTPSFTKDIRQELEQFWKQKLKDQNPAITKVTGQQEKFYVLSMFPYPSGRLHMGHVRVYTISDVMARFHRLMGKHVIHPMGWDAFGLPAENAAIERGEKPDVWTYSNIETMKEQMESLCYSFDWNTELATCDPEYYRWTQYIFLKMFEKGLVYQKMGAVNWDPVDQTVLADEQIDGDGRSWRSGAVAEKRFIRQWYIKTTAFSKSLIDGLSEVRSELWKDVLDLQRHWIGDCNGVRLEFKLRFMSSGESIADPLSVFTHHPQLIYGASHILISSQHYLNNTDYYMVQGNRENGLMRLNVTATNLFSEQELPIFVCEDWKYAETLDSYLAIPDCDDWSKSVAASLSLPYTSVIGDDGVLVNSGKFSGMEIEKAFEIVATEAKRNNCGGDITSEKARDWLISRQRFWGTPIPIIHCPRYGPVPVAYEDLPVTLPQVTAFTGKGESPLVKADDWRKLKCPQCDCDSYGLRETDTMDTFVDSTWYFLRYLDNRNKEEPVNPKKAAHFMPVDLYIGGKEHATMHLYYARFIHHFLHSLGVVPQREPFVNLLTQGMVMGQSYQVEASGQYLPPDQVDFSGSMPVDKNTGASLLVQWEKMSKSKYNGVDPQDVLNEFGCDSTRLAILSNVAPKSDRHWSNDVFHGVLRWQARVWSLVSAIRQRRTEGAETVETELQDHVSSQEEEIRNFRNYFVNEINFHMNQTFLLNVVISRLQGLTNALKKVPVAELATSCEGERAVADLLIMLAPFTPLFATELWQGLRDTTPHVAHPFNWDDTVWNQCWPVVDTDHRISLKVKIDGRDQFRVPLPMETEEISNMTREDALTLVKQETRFQEALKGRPIISSTIFIEPGVRVELNISTKKKKKKKPHLHK